jgi:hypothetical protein
MVNKTASVTLFSTGGSLHFDNVEIISYSQHSIAFTLRKEEGDEVTITDYTSTLPYLINETMTGPKSLLK